MNCMKCGTELKTSGVFCEECLAEMEKYPVKPNIKVVLPHRSAPTAPRKRSRRQKYTTPEEQIRHLKKVRNRLVVLLLVAFLALCIAGANILRLMDISVKDFDIGQNYETVTDTD